MRNLRKLKVCLWFDERKLRSALNLPYQEAERPLGGGGCFPGEEAEWTGEREDGGNQDPVWSGWHYNQRQQQEQGIQERRNRAGEFCSGASNTFSILVETAGYETPGCWIFPTKHLYVVLFVFLQYDDEDERNGVTQGDKLRALKSKRQSRSSSGSLS